MVDGCGNSVDHPNAKAVPAGRKLEPLSGNILEEMPLS